MIAQFARLAGSWGTTRALERCLLPQYGLITGPGPSHSLLSQFAQTFQLPAGSSGDSFFTAGFHANGSSSDAHHDSSTCCGVKGGGLGQPSKNLERFGGGCGMAGYLGRAPAAKGSCATAPPATPGFARCQATKRDGQQCTSRAITNGCCGRESHQLQAVQLQHLLDLQHLQHLQGQLGCPCSRSRSTCSPCGPCSFCTPCCQAGSLQCHTDTSHSPYSYAGSPRSYARGPCSCRDCPRPAPVASAAPCCLDGPRPAPAAPAAACWPDSPRAARPAPAAPAAACWPDSPRAARPAPAVPAAACWPDSPRAARPAPAVPAAACCLDSSRAAPAAPAAACRSKHFGTPGSCLKRDSQGRVLAEGLAGCWSHVEKALRSLIDPSEELARHGLTYNTVLVVEGGCTVGPPRELGQQVPDEPGVFIVMTREPGSMAWVPVRAGKAGGQGIAATLRTSMTRNWFHKHTFGPTGKRNKYEALMRRGGDICVIFITGIEDPNPKHFKKDILGKINFRTNSINNGGYREPL